MLPSTFSTPAYFSTQELEELRGSPNYHYAKQRLATARKAYDGLSSVIFKEYPESTRFNQHQHIVDGRPCAHSVRN